MYKWPLNDSQFTVLDRIKIASFFLNPKNKWTQDKYVKAIERKICLLTSYKYSVFCSSGTAANTILAMYLRDTVSKERNIVVLPSVTWQTSCSPFIREGFEPHFIDIDLNGLGMDLNKLKYFLEKNDEKVAAVFPTSLLGHNLNYEELNKLKASYPSVNFYIDQCENTLGIFESSCIGDGYRKYTCSTSTYFGHQLQSVEGGFLLTNKEDEYYQFLMYRNHGMTRGLDSIAFGEHENLKRNFSNNKVDERFDFYSFGSNFRNTDINAYIGLLDMDKIFSNIRHRRILSHFFKNKLNSMYLKNKTLFNEILFCLPIILKNHSPVTMLRIKDYCNKNGIETRPIISGFLGYQTAYERFKLEEKDFPNSIHIHHNGLYVGLHTGIRINQVNKLVDFLNSL